MPVVKEQYKFVEVPHDLTDSDYAFTSGKLRVFGYKPTFLNTGTVLFFVNNRPFKPGDQWSDEVPESHPIEKDYELVIGQDLIGTPDVVGLPYKPGVWLRLSYYLKVTV